MPIPGMRPRLDPGQPVRLPFQDKPTWTRQLPQLSQDIPQLSQDKPSRQLSQDKAADPTLGLTSE
jgi:hypothetical protein